MATLHLDLSRDARRRTILADLRGRLSAEQLEELDASIAAAGVPDRHHHDIGEVNATIDFLNVSDRVKQDMRAIYDILANAEATVHGCPVEHTHFHEVGNGEAIRCVCEICLAIEMIDPESITATPVQTGSGTVVCAHGELPIPAPATKAILDQGIPTSAELGEGELCTPTSAAVIKHFVERFE